MPTDFENLPPGEAERIRRAARLRRCLALLRWTQRGFADTLGVSEATVRRWLNPDDAATPPEGVWDWIEALAAHAERHPVPLVDPVRAAQARVRLARSRRGRNRSDAAAGEQQAA